MSSPATRSLDEGGGQRRRARSGGLVLAALWTLFGYFWLLPLVRPRGVLLWGHYQFRDLFLGLPVALAAIGATVVMAQPSGARRPLGLRLALASASTLLACAVCDALVAFAGLRMSTPLERRGLARAFNLPDPELGHVRQPFVSWRGPDPTNTRQVSLRTDENGFRNPPGLRRADLVFVGDSFTEASEVEDDETFVRRLERTSRMTAANLGRAGYGPAQELIVLQRYGMGYRPRVVIWQIYEGNDLVDAERFAAWKLDRHGSMETDDPLLHRYMFYSPLFRFLDRTVALRHAPRAGDDRALLLRLGQSDDDPDQPAAFPLGWREMENALRTGSALCRERGIPLLVVLIPVKLRVEAPELRRALDAADRRRLDGLLDDKRYLGTAVEPLSRSAGFAYLDASRALRAAAGRQRAYLPGNTHLDVAGHALVAEALYDALVQFRGRFPGRLTEPGISRSGVSRVGSVKEAK